MLKLSLKIIDWFLSLILQLEEKKVQGRRKFIVRQQVVRTRHLRMLEVPVMQYYIHSSMMIHEEELMNLIHLDTPAQLCQRFHFSTRKRSHLPTTLFWWPIIHLQNKEHFQVWVAWGNEFWYLWWLLKNILIPWVELLKWHVRFPRTTLCLAWCYARARVLEVP